MLISMSCSGLKEVLLSNRAHPVVDSDTVVLPDSGTMLKTLPA